jgi:hypothetical protein
VYSSFNQFLYPSCKGSRYWNDSISVISCDASPLPGKNGTLIFTFAFCAAFSIAALPPNTIRSAMLTFLFNPVWISVSFDNTFASFAGSFPSQSFCGAKRILEPFAPPL